MNAPANVLSEVLKAQLRLTKTDSLYAVVDGAQDYFLAFDALKNFHCQIRPLFQGDSAARLNQVAPYMVPIRIAEEGHEAAGLEHEPSEPAPPPMDAPDAHPNDRDFQTEEELLEIEPPPNPLDYLERWAESWGQHAGILLVAKSEPEEFYKHLRGLFVAKDERGQEYFFRYYDPRVLRVYLPTCTPEEVEEFFGPITRIVFEGEKPETILVASPTDEGVKLDSYPVNPPAPTPA